MASNYTENYGLCQWEATDQVLRTDFNGDNAKLETALSNLEARVALLDRAVPNLAFYIGQLSLQDLVERNQYLAQKSMLYEAFRFPSVFSLTGGAQIINNVLTVSGMGTTGTATTQDTTIYSSNWTVARMWMHGQGGSVKVYLNGEEMEWVTNSFSPEVSGETVFEREYVWRGTGIGSAQIKLALDCSNSATMSIYDYCIVFF